MSEIWIQQNGYSKILPKILLNDVWQTRNLNQIQKNVKQTNYYLNDVWKN